MQPYLEVVQSSFDFLKKSEMCFCECFVHLKGSLFLITEVTNARRVIVIRKVTYHDRAHAVKELAQSSKSESYQALIYLF